MIGIFKGLKFGNNLFNSLFLKRQLIFPVFENSEQAIRRAAGKVPYAVFDEFLNYPAFCQLAEDVVSMSAL